MKHNLIIFLLSAILSIAGGKAQHFGANESDTKPITWRANARMISNTEGVITFTATMAEGWHLYGMQMPPDGPKPTRFTFETNTGVVLNGKLSVDKAPIKNMIPYTIPKWNIGKVRWYSSSHLKFPIKMFRVYVLNVM